MVLMIFDVPFKRDFSFLKPSFFLTSKQGNTVLSKNFIFSSVFWDNQLTPSFCLAINSASPLMNLTCSKSLSDFDLIESYSRSVSFGGSPPIGLPWGLTNQHFFPCINSDLGFFFNASCNVVASSLVKIRQVKLSGLPSFMAIITVTMGLMHFLLS